MDIVKRTIETYDKIAHEYCRTTRQPKFLEWEEGYIKRLLDYVSKQSPTVLNVGCGDGRDNIHIDNNGGKCIGIDLSDGMLEEARSLYPRGDFRKMDMRELLFDSDAFDGIWASGSIYHVRKSELPRVIGEFRRVLRRYGVIALNFKIGEGEGLEDNPKSFSGLPRYFAYYTKEEMKANLEEVGFEEIESCRYPEEIFGDKIQQMWFRLKHK
jgi:ubiquinone/menaquinone biosynthesis C-methylase UbiE